MAFSSRLRNAGGIWLLPIILWAGTVGRAAAQPPNSPPTSAAPPERKFTAAEQVQLAEAGKLNSRVIALYRTGKFAEAVPLAKQVLAIRKQVLGEKHPAYASSLSNLAELYKAQGNYAQAGPLFVEALAINKQALGEKHPDYATSLNNLAALYWAQGSYAKAEPLLVEALAIRKQVSGENHPDYATSLSNLAELYRDQGKYAKAEPHFVEALAIRKQVLGENHPDYAASLNNLAALYQDQGKYAKAEPLYVDALAIRKQVLGEKHPDYAASLNNLAVLYDNQGNYAKAEPLYVEALAIRKQVLGEKHPDYAVSLSNLAGLYKAQGNYAKAEPLYVEALAIRKHVLGEKHPAYATSLNDLAAVYDDQGNYAKAESLYVQALAIRKQVLGKNHPDYAVSLSNLALLYGHQGNYAKAEPLLVEALEICKQVLGEKHPLYAISLNNLAAMYWAQGNYAKAESLLVAAAVIDKQALGEKHPGYASDLNNLAMLYSAQGNHAKAEPLLVEALAIRKQILGEKHPDYATSQSNLAALYQAEGNYAKAEPLFVEALAIRKQVLGEKHPDYAVSLNNLAELYEAEGKHAKAEPIYAEALAIRKQALGDKHPGYATELNNLAGCEIGLHSFGAAADHARQAAEIRRYELEQTAAVQSEHQQLLMADDARPAFSMFLSAGRAAGTPAESVYDEVLAWKGAVTGRQAFRKSLRPDLAKSPQAAALYGQLEAAASELAVEANRVPGSPQLETYKKRLGELGAEVEDLQTKLTKLSAPFAQQRAQQNRTAAELRQALPADTALVDMIEYDYYGWTEESKDEPIWQSRVAAFVVRHDRPTTSIDLGPSADIDRAIEAWRAGFGRGEMSQQAAAALRKNVWQPLEAELAGAKTVLISPDGELAKFPWAALPGTKPGSYLIEERAMAVIPIPQALPELLAKNTVAGAAPSLLLVGDVDYGGDPGVLLASNDRQRAIRDGSVKWSPLPGTRAEILAIRDSFEQRFVDGRTKQLRKQDATAEAVRASAPSYRYLHFATHGFFADPKIRSVLTSSGKPESQFDLNRHASLNRVTGEHPGLLSGIVLTGANQPPAEGKGDGILTALEVGELDLSGVDLVTLSACETGLGKTAGGEGLLGLQRAFQTAGARSTVTSLWKIPDAATRSLMIDFYENLWTKKMSKAEALRQAQLALMREGVKRGLELESAKPADSDNRLPPYYWAAFVLSGDWR